MSTWRDYIRDLEATGSWSLTQLGAEIELSPQALSDIKQGRSTAPRGMAAVKLHQLWERECGPKRSKPAAKVA